MTPQAAAPVDVNTSAGRLYRRLNLDSYWHIPFSLWTKDLVRGLLWIIHDTARTRVTHGYSRIRTWQKCAWLSGVRPNCRTSPACIFDSAPYFGFSALGHFARIISSRRSNGDNGTLGECVRPVKCASWNVTSLHSEEQRAQLVPIIKAITRTRILMIQESKLEPCGHALQARFPMTSVHVSANTTGAKGGSSAGLVTIVPLHLT